VIVAQVKYLQLKSSERNSADYFGKQWTEIVELLAEAVKSKEDDEFLKFAGEMAVFISKLSFKKGETFWKAHDEILDKNCLMFFEKKQTMEARVLLYYKAMHD